MNPPFPRSRACIRVRARALLRLAPLLAALVPAALAAEEAPAVLRLSIAVPASIDDASAASGAPAAPNDSAEDVFAQESAAFDSLMADTAHAVAEARPLLPARLSPAERLLWDENGWMREAFDFPLTPEGRAEELRTRHNLLALHQIAGFATLAAMTATVVLGQLAYNGDESMGRLHAPIAWTTVAAYFTTAGIAIFTPPPALRRGEWNTVSTHKLLATLHFTGMMLTPALGRMVARDHRDLRTVHLVSGYVTTATFAGAMLVVTF